MAEVIDWTIDPVKKELPQLKKEMELLELIYMAPMQVVDNDLYLADIIGNGYHCNALCEALEVETLEIEYEGKIHKLRRTRPPFGLTHYDIMFQTKACQERNFVI